MYLENLISPIAVKDFIERYKGQEYFVIHKEINQLKGLFSWAQLNDLLYTHRLNSPRFRLIRNGEVVDPQTYTNYVNKTREGLVPKIDSAKLSGELAKGTAVHILAVDEFSPELTAICTEISELLSSKISMTMHIGMAESKGFHQHWDSHDVLVLQLHGKKHWKLYGFTENYPYREGPAKEEINSNAVIWEGDLDEGDILFVPRGSWHDVQAYNEACMHISIGMFNPKSVDYISWINSQLTQFEFFRKDTPVTDDPKIIEDYLNVLKSKLTGFITAKTYGAFLKQNTNTENNRIFTLPQI